MLAFTTMEPPTSEADQDGTQRWFAGLPSVGVIPPEEVTDVHRATAARALAQVRRHRWMLIVGAVGVLFLLGITYMRIDEIELARETCEQGSTPRGKQFVIRLTNPYHSESTHVSGNRMAIANIRERLQLHFDAEASLKADVQQDKYVVTITMPVEKQDI